MTSLPPISHPVVLCATHRLVRSLQLRAARPGGVAEAPPAFTLTDWLASVTEEAVLLGRTSAAGHLRALDPLAERIVWRQVIEASLADRPDLALLDVHGLADTAAEAHALVEAWSLHPDGPVSEETRRFLGWRQDFLRLCRSRGWVDATRRLRWQIECIEAGVCRLPGHIALAGFDRLDPLHQRLLAALRAAGTVVDSYPLGVDPDAPPQQLQLADGDQELQRAVAWARSLADARPGWRIGIVVPELGQERERIARLLDDALDPAAIRPANAEAARCYNISLGRPLAEQPVIAVGLGLLRLAVNPRQILQRDLGRLLNAPYWAADQREMTGCAALDALLRATLPFGTALDAVIRRARRLIVDGQPIHKTTDALEALRDAAAALGRSQRPSAHAAHFLRLLKTAGWPGERALSSHEYQAVQAFREAVARVAELDELLGPTPAGSVLGTLGEACRETLFQPRTEGQPPIQVLGLLEAALETFDALWVTGMTDQTWPPPARPNPLLPAALQRAAGSPHASPDVQSAFAGAIHQRLCRAAPTVIFSWPARDGERELSPSPLLAAIPVAGEVFPPPATTEPLIFVERFFATLPDADARLEALDDHRAPAVADDELVRGGTAILRAQALCPAWAFFRYRLQAKALETPVEGLDSAGRGTVAHKVMEAFWRGQRSAEVFGWPADVLKTRIADAVAAGLLAFETEQDEPLPAGFRGLERERLEDLLVRWVAIERGRPDPFVVEDCEAEQTVDICGVQARVVVDRIDRLADGRAVLLDYKTGSTLKLAGWSEARPSEPQLPIYAAYALADEPLAAVAFAHLAAQPPAFVGVSEDEAILPGVKALAASRRRFPEGDFADWPALRATWAERLAQLAAEIRQGEAAVRFAREADLQYSEVLPLLRLAERAAQFARATRPGASPASQAGEAADPRSEPTAQPA